MSKKFDRNICPVCGGRLVQVEVERDDSSTYAAETIRQKCKHCGCVFVKRKK